MLNLCSLLLAATAGASQESPEARLGAYLEQLEGVGFSGVVPLRSAGEIVLNEAYGLADRENGRPMNTESVLTVGSITKQFTAAAIVLLESEGRLSVEDRLDAHFADVPDDKAAITLHQLLTHTAGFPGAIGGDFDPDATAERFTDDAFAAELLFPPGAAYEYSNVGYSLLGILIEKISGMPYETFLAERLFKPANMRRTGYLAPGYESKDLAVGYVGTERWGTVLERPMLSDGPSWHLRANGGIHSNAEDMLRWFAALNSDQVVPASAKRKLFTPHVDEGGGSHYGYGWAIDETPWGAKRISHNGGNMVFFADLHHYPDQDLTLYVATNVSSSFRGLSRHLVHALFGREAELPPKTIKASPEELARVVGTYSLDPQNSITVETAGNGLLIHAQGGLLGSVLTGSDSELAARTKSIAEGVARGELDELIAAFGGRMTPAELEQAFQQLREGWRQNLGAFDGAGTSGARSGDGALAFAELRFERGSEFVLFTWDNGKIVEVALESEAPWPASADAPVTFFPVSANRFVAWSLASGEGAGLAVEPTNAGEPELLLSRGGTEYRLQASPR